MHQKYSYKACHNTAWGNYTYSKNINICQQKYFTSLVYESKMPHSNYSDLTHWGRVTHICVSKLIVIGSDNGLSPGQRQAIIWTNAGMLLIGPMGTNFSEISIKIHIFSFNKMHLKMSSGKWRPFCLGLNVLSFTSIFAILIKQITNCVLHTTI